MSLHGSINVCLSRLAATASPSATTQLQHGPPVPPPLPWQLLNLHRLRQQQMKQQGATSEQLGAARREMCHEVQFAAGDQQTGLRIAGRLFKGLSSSPDCCRQLARLLCDSSSLVELLLESCGSVPNEIRLAVWQEFAQRAIVLGLRQRAAGRKNGGRGNASARGSSSGGDGSSGGAASGASSEVKAAAEDAQQALLVCTQLSSQQDILGQHGSSILATLRAVDQLAKGCAADGSPLLPAAAQQDHQQLMVGWASQASLLVEDFKGSRWQRQLSLSCQQQMVALLGEFGLQCVENTHGRFLGSLRCELVELQAVCRQAMQCTVATLPSKPGTGVAPDSLFYCLFLAFTQSSSN